MKKMLCVSVIVSILAISMLFGGCSTKSISILPENMLGMNEAFLGFDEGFTAIYDSLRLAGELNNEELAEHERDRLEWGMVVEFTTRDDLPVMSHYIGEKGKYPDKLRPFGLGLAPKTKKSAMGEEVTIWRFKWKTDSCFLLKLVWNPEKLPVWGNFSILDRESKIVLVDDMTQLDYIYIPFFLKGDIEICSRKW